MSDSINTQWYERASEMISYWEGTTIGRILERDIETNDLSALVAHVAIAEAQASQQEFEATDVI